MSNKMCYCLFGLLAISAILRPSVNEAAGASVGNLDYGAPPDCNGNAVGYSLSNANTYPSIRYAGSLASDPSNRLYQGEATIFAASSAWLSGRVTDAYTCLPIEGASIRIANAWTNWSVTTGTNGDYSLLLPSGPLSIDISALASGYATGMVSVALPAAGSGVTQNFELATSRLTFAPAGLDEFILADGQVTNRLVVSNSGPLTLSYVLHVGTHRDVRTNELFQYDASRAAAATDCLGVEFDGTNFWMTGSGLGSNPNFLYKLTKEGAYVARFEQGTSSVWGWRDLAFDGIYLYASDSAVIQQISRVNGQPTGVTIPGPLDPNRALAYDPETDHFWVAGFATPIYEIDRSGHVLHHYDNTLAIFGLAWDNSSPDGPWLWVWSQNGMPSCRLSRFNPRTGSFTDYSRQGLANPGGYAGGACFALLDQYRIVASIHQVSGDDWMIGYIVSEIAPEWVTLSANAGVLGASSSEMFRVVFDSYSAASAPPSTSLAWLSFDGDYVHEPLPMPLTMRVVVDGLTVTPADALHFNGSVGGPFDSVARELVVGNVGTNPFSWSVTASQNWLTPMPTNGVVAVGATQALRVAINTNAGTLPLGEYKAQLTFSNRTSGTCILRDVELLVRHDRKTICSYNMETDPGWITQGQWAFGVPQGGGSYNRDPTSGFTGSNVYGYNLTGDYNNDLPRRCLMTTPLNFSRYAHVDMSFRRWLGVEDARYDRASIECSADGANWTEVWRNSGKAIADTCWQAITCELTSVTYTQSSVYVRWVMGETDDSVTYPGWNIDDVVFSGSLLRQLTIRSDRGQVSPVSGEYLYHDGLLVSCGITNDLIQDGSYTQYVFTGWAQDGCAPTSGTSADITFALTNDAILTWLWNTNVYFSVTANAHGSVAGSDSGWHELGDEVLAWAMADSHYHFVSWAGVPDSQTNENPLMLTLDRARLITARFSVDSQRLTVKSEFGSPSPAVGTHPNDYGAVLTNTVNQYDTQGSTQQVCAGWTMRGNEPNSGLTNRFVVTLTNDATLTWLWRTNFYFTCSAGSNGSVIGSDSGWYAQGDFVTVSAHSLHGYYFAGWTGDVPAWETNANPLTLMMDRPRSVQATFRRVVTYTNTIARMTEWLTNRMAQTDVVGLSIVLVDDQSTIWADGFGYADWSNGIPVDQDTVFGIGSLTRTLGAAAIMQLTETFGVDLDAPLTNYLPQFSIQQRFSNNDITLRTILDDHSGIPGDLLNGAFTTRPWTNYTDWLIEWLGGEYTTAPTNTIWADNHSGYAVLSRVIQQVAGLSFCDYAVTNLFQRMNMIHSAFYPDEPCLTNRLAKPYCGRVEYPLEFGNGTTAGSVYSSASDMAQYIKMILAYGEGANGSVLQSNTVEQMMTQQNGGNPYDAVAVGLAWFVKDAPLDYAGRLCWREGRSVFYRCMLKILRDHKLGVFVACNSADDGGIQDAAVLRCLQLALEDKTGITPPPPYAPPFAPATNWPVANLDAVTGVYVTAFGYDRVRRNGGTLELVAGAHSDLPEILTNLVPRTNGWFSIPASQNVQFEFRLLDGRHILFLHEIVHDAPSTILRGEQRMSLPAIPAAWSNRLGEHDMINLQEYDVSRVCPFDLQTVGLSVKLAIKDGLLLAVSPFDRLGTMVLEPQSDSLAFVLGLGRNRGQALQVVQTNGFERLRWMGCWYQYALPTLDCALMNGTNFVLTVSNIHAGVTGRIERTGKLLSPIHWETRYFFTPSSGGSFTNWSESMETNSAFYRFLYK